jgi:hypothetical protein
MTDNATPQASPIPTTPDPVPAPRKKRWLRRIVIGLSVVVVLLIGLVVLLPTIVSLSPVRSMVMSQVSGYLDGRAEVESWSIGWFSPLSVQGLRVYDNDNAMVLDISKLQTEATLGSLVRGNLDLGKTRAAIDATKVIIYPDGTTNLHRIARLTDAEPKPRKEETESSIPDVKVDLTLQLTAGVQLLDASGKPVTMLQVRPGSGGTIKIADINKGIDTDLKLVYIVDAGTTSTVSIIGSADAIEGNQIAIDQLTAKLRILLQDIDTAAARPVLVMAGVQGVEVGGLVNGQIDADLQPGQAGSIKGTPTVTNVVFAHSTIADRYQAREVSFPIDVSRVIENGVTRLKIDIRAIAPELSAAITGDIAESSIAQLQARQLPGADGQIAVELTADPAKAAKSLPNTFKLLPGVTVAGGTVHAKSDVWLKPSSIVYGVSTNLSASGTHDGKPISIEPVTLTTRGTVVDLANPVQGLRDLSLDLASRFATFNATGTSATTLSGKGSADLGLLRQQLAQFSDLSNTQLAGKAAITLANTPKTGTADAYALNLTLTLNDIKATLPDTPLIDLPFVKVGVESGYVLGTDSGNPIQQIDTTTATVLAGTSAEKPLADVLIVLSNIDPKARTGSFDLQRATITSLPELQKMIDPFVPQLLQQQIELTGGAVYVVTKGSADLLAGRITLDSFDFSAPSLRINRAGKLFIDEKRIALSTAGQLSAGEQIVIDLSRFSLESAIATLTTNAKPLSITLGAEGLPRGNGTINATIRLPQLNRIAQSLSTEPINTVSSGQLTGDLSFANTDG